MPPLTGTDPSPKTGRGSGLPIDQKPGGRSKTGWIRYKTEIACWPTDVVGT